MVHTCNSSTQKAEVGGSGIQHCPGPHSMTMFITPHTHTQRKTKNKKGTKEKEREGIRKDGGTVWETNRNATSVL